MFNAAVRREVENRLLTEVGDVEVAGMNQQFILFGPGFDDDLAVRIDDQAAANQGMTILDSGLGNADDPGGLPRRTILSPGRLDRDRATG